jgi:hypothetical protein
MYSAFAFDADEPPLLVAAGHAGGSRAEERIEHDAVRGVTSFTSQRINSTGFTVGWMFRAPPVRPAPARGVSPRCHPCGRSLRRLRAGRS